LYFIASGDKTSKQKRPLRKTESSVIRLIELFGPIVKAMTQRFLLQVTRILFNKKPLHINVAGAEQR
jgi:hypothetical protein